ncbi:radical SAM protein [Thermospira aquatica]|uniref:Radical SAM protein n=1 Tax=Thermospira aquatica TaxID=2828656 RepID=A0AAX3BC04_9SPIR|nr:radical SAM protein [Thermospira aquatica]URA09630.1 radical SAM protein [Thermospira aquatica]
MRFLLIDGYIDEPTALGVPPYISPYVRYVAGAIWSAGGHELLYRTIDQLRETHDKPDADFVILIAGNPVPGKYLGGNPITLDEVKELADFYRKKNFLWGGPQSREKNNNFSKNIQVISGDIEAYVWDIARNNTPRERFRSLEEWHVCATFGAEVVLQHPWFPDVVIELETGRGCPRRFHCSFCLEGLFEVEFRPVASIQEEVNRLYQVGCRHFRLGKQADILSYQADFSCERDGFFRPVPENLERLYSGIREVAPDLKTLHLDNMNPGTIARFPKESARILETIARYNTPGDVAAFGMESADPEVIRRNALKASPDQVFQAIQMVNEIGGKRDGGIPKLLPGVNLIHGLPGETRETFRLNYEFLLQIFEEGLLLRRINIRQLKQTPGTPLEHLPLKKDVKTEAAFRHYREKIRKEIDIPMLQRIFPPGTVLRDLIVDGHRGEWSLARQLGSYPIIVKIPRNVSLREHLDAFVIDYRERSLIGLCFPFDVKKLSYHEIQQIPGMAKKAGMLVAQKEISLEDFRESPLYEVLVSCSR